MPRREVPFLPDQYYHFYNRGNNRQAIFFERDNYLFFLRRLKKYICEDLDILCYCLMPTHYHILARVKTKTDNVSRSMQKFGISYTKAINTRFDRVGSLFQGQFKGKPVQDDCYLRHLCVYIHANPVKDRLVLIPEQWEFSNYLEWMNQRAGTLVNRDFISEYFGTPNQYQALVTEYIQSKTWWTPEV